MKTITKRKVESAEFRLQNGIHVVWHKQSSGWSVTRYVHGEIGKTFHTISHLPSIINAVYFAEKEF